MRKNLNHGWLGYTRMKLQGFAWVSQAGMDFQIPPQTRLHEILKTIAHFAPKNALHLNGHKIKAKNTGLRLVSKRGDVVKKHLQARLRVSFPQQRQHSCSESTLCFLSSYPCISFLSVVKMYALPF
jgi:hypothetical protein